MLRRAHLFAVFLLGLGADARAAAPDPRSTGTPFLRTWRAEDYRASPVNWRVLPHPATGLVYVSNNFGVLELDGATVRLIPLPRGGAARALALDAAGRIWVGGVGELARLEPDASGRLAAVDVTDRIAAGATGRELPPVGDDAEPEGAARGPAPLRGLGNLNRAVAGPDAVYIRLPDTVARLATDGTAALLPAAARLGQLFWADGALHAGDLDRGLVRFGADGPAPVEPGGRTDAFAAQPDPDGGWRLLTLRGPQRWRGPGTLPEPLRADAADPFDDAEPTGAIFLADGRMAYGTTRSGLFLFDRTGRLERRLDRTHGLPANRINGLAQDREGGLWLALHVGLVRIELDSPFAVHGPAQGLVGGPRALLRAGPRLYVTHGEGLAWRDDATGDFHAVPGLRTGSHRLAPGNGDRVFATGLGLFELSPARAEPAHLPGPYLYGLAPLQRHPGWLVASTALALRFYREEPPGAWQPAGTSRTLPAGADDLLETADGFLWAVTRFGEIWRLDLRAGPSPDAPAQRYGPDRGLPALLRRDNPRLLRLGGDLVVASAQGLFRHDAARDRFAPDPRFPGLADPVTRRGPAMSVPASDGGAWFYFDGVAPRLVRLRAAPDGTWTTAAFSAAPLRDLVVNHLCHDPAQRTVWIAAQGALLSFDTAWQAALPRPPVQAIVRSVTAAGAAVPRAQLDALPPEMTALRFDYAAPSFGADYAGRTDTLYRTRLEGFETAWSGWRAEPYRDFTNLAPGKFTFRVQARDFSGATGGETALAFTLLAPWWRTPWAYAGGALLGIGAVAGLVLLRTRALHARAAQLEAIVAARTGELAAHNLELERLRRLELDEKIAAQLAAERARHEMLRYQLNPHFLYNAFNSLYGLVYPHSRPAGELVRRLAEFCRGTLTRPQDQWHSLGEEVAMLRTYLDIEQARWQERLRVEVTVDPDALGLRLPALLLLPLVENAVKHGSTTSPALLGIRLSVTRDDDGAAVVEIANTGRWLPPAAARRADSTGIGLENVVARLDRSFPGSHGFTIEPRDGWVTVRLRLPPPTPAAG